MAPSPADRLHFLINTVAFPRRLPSSADKFKGLGDQLLYHIQQSAVMLSEKLAPTYQEEWEKICRALKLSRKVNVDGRVSSSALKQVLASLDTESVFVYVKEQNAGLIIKRSHLSEYVFEAFEASPRSADVLASEGALLWSFPGSAMAVKADTFHDPGFQKELSDFLETASAESVKAFVPVSKKGALETRDTVNPELITHCLMTLLQAYGRRLSPLDLTQKRVRDEVLWFEGSELPWRRHPIYLVVRVFLQRALVDVFGEEIGHLQYKTIMSFAVARLLAETLDAKPSCFKISGETIAFMRSKLARRLNKLERIQPTLTDKAVEAHRNISTATTPVFEEILQNANDRLEQMVQTSRNATTKKITSLPREPPVESLTMQLRNSGSFLEQVLAVPPRSRAFTSAALEQSPRRLSFDATGFPILKFHPSKTTVSHDELFDFEAWVGEELLVWMQQTVPSDETCLKVSTVAEAYKAAASDAYLRNPQRLSKMVLTLFELWSVLDKIVLELCPLLASYDTRLRETLFEPLQFETPEDLRRLSAVESYVAERGSEVNIKLPHVFSDPDDGSFASTYYEMSPDMIQLHAEIQRSSDEAFRRKEHELREKTVEYESLVQRQRVMTCTCGDDDQTGRRGHLGECPKYKFQTQAQEMGIAVVEAMLPAQVRKAQSLIFELVCPKFFVCWRDVTWMLLFDLGHAGGSQHPPQLLLRDYESLAPYRRNNTGRLTLASRAKSFLPTHYRLVTLPVPIEKVCLPHPLKLASYDVRSSNWTHRLFQLPDYSPFCSPPLPKNDPYSIFRKQNGQSPTNQIIATQGKASSQLLSLEYIAISEMFWAEKLFWPMLMRELSSANINFNAPGASIILCGAITTMGSFAENDFSRNRDWPFSSEEFCLRLLECLTGRITATENNWHEVRSSKVVIVILLRIRTLASSSQVQQEAAQLLLRMRQITLTWTRKLRHEVVGALDDGTRRLRQTEMIAAVHLCQKTFELEAATVDDMLTASNASIFIETSIYDQEIRFELAKYGSQSKNDALNNFELKHRLEPKLKSAILTTDALHEAINGVWPGHRTYRMPSALLSPHSSWFQCSTLGTDEVEEVAIHYSLHSGSLLISGLPLGQLPKHYTEHPLYKEVFGLTTKFAYPSEMPGMTHCLVQTVAQHTVHFGSREGKLIMRVQRQRRTYELVPSNVFRSRQAQVEDDDLPWPLIDGCVHWLNTSLANRGILEIRPKSSSWESKPSNWQLDVFRRRLQKSGENIIDSRTSIFAQIASVIEPFESWQHILALKSKAGRTAVHLPRFDLRFEVNEQGLLYCVELGSVIDRNQDIGTLHGFRSMLVLRCEKNDHERSALVPIVHPTVSIENLHVNVFTVTAESTVRYFRFFVDPILGRLVSTYEPRIVYYQALLHAVTSFVIPDRLTGCTGVEEAIKLLKSAFAQPWRPLDVPSIGVLNLIIALTPIRTFYPEELNCMQKVAWNARVSEASQHDEFAYLASCILFRHKDLQAFYASKSTQISASRGEERLTRRALSRHRLLQTPLYEDIEESKPPEDLAYNSRHALRWSLSCAQVYEIATSVSRWEPNLSLLPNVCEIFAECPLVGGFHQPLETASLDSIMHIDVLAQWGSLFSLCQQLTQADRHRAVFFFSLMSYKTDFMESIRVLSSCLTVQSVSRIALPPWSSYSHFSQGYRPSIGGLADLMNEARLQYPEDARASIPRLAFKIRRKFEVAEENHVKAADSQLQDLVESLLTQWPCAEPNAVGYRAQTHVDVDCAISLVLTQWTRLWENHHLQIHLQEVQSALKQYAASTTPQQRKLKYPTKTPSDRHVHRPVSPLPSFDMWLKYARPDPYYGKESSERRGRSESDSIKPVSGQTLGKVKGRARDSTPEDRQRNLDELYSIIRPLLASESIVRRRYGGDLSKSIEAFRVSQGVPEDPLTFLDSGRMEKAISAKHDELKVDLRELSRPFREDQQHRWLTLGDIHPRVTTCSLLASMSSQSKVAMDKVMKEDAIVFALELTQLQRWTRILNHWRKSKQQMFQDELQNVGHTNWDPRSHLDWLLLEIEGNFLVREEQFEVAQAMINPPSARSSTLQLNMGRGKSSVIIPMICCSLADSKHLVRVVIPKALLAQAASILIPRLGKLLGRTIQHVPFSRRTLSNSASVTAFFKLHETCAAGRGITLALPEHLLSFRLSGQQMLSNGSQADAEVLLRTQTWLDTYSRDVLDESDFILNPRTQLIYPSGIQFTLDAQRWKTVQSCLHLVKLILPGIKAAYPQGIEIAEHSHGGYPTVFILRKEAESVMLDQLAELISSGHGGIIPMTLQADERSDVKAFLRSERVTKRLVSRVQQVFDAIPDGWNSALLVRGLLVYRLLVLCLAKRFNVSYGLHPGRAPVAVPFNAKGVPTENSEFGHVDVTILLSCLSFYNAGLNLEQFRRCLEQMLRSDDPSVYWDALSKQNPSLPTWNNVNPDDEMQCTSLWNILRHSAPLINFYLNQEIFPRYCHAYEQKLVSNGWDLIAAAARLDGKSNRPRPTTGFSGTSDGKYLLPLNIEQSDLQFLAGTSAEVLSYLLQPRNRSYLLIKDRSVESLLTIVSKMQPPVKTILDAGAMIRELTNRSVAAVWLKIKHSADAAVFFDELDRIMILHHDGREEPLGVSPFSGKLENCLVYLDEAHTRGTDLPFPNDARAIVTLGPSQTKDHTVQAAMRLRQLGTTHSIVFAAPPEVHSSICDVTGKQQDDNITSREVVSWLLEMTCASVENLLPFHISQGRDFCRRETALMNNRTPTTDEWQREALLKALVQKEEHTVKALYEPKIGSRTLATLRDAPSDIQKYLAELQNMQEALSDASLSNAVQGRIHDEVEVEVEVEAEIEAEAVREIQKIPVVDAFSGQPLHSDILRFARFGDLVPKSSAYSQVFEAIYKTTTGKQLALLSRAYRSQLFVSLDFTRTVVPTGVRTPDDYLRPVNWLLWSKVSNAAIIISPFEAEELVDILRVAQPPRTHMIVYAAPVIRKMMVFEKHFYSIPSLPKDWTMPAWLVLDLGFFAGRMYFGYQQYSSLRARFALDAPDEVQGQSDAIVSTSALPFLHDWLTLRRKNQEWSHTPMGFVCRARRLTPDMAFFEAGNESEREQAKPKQKRRTGEDNQTACGQLEYIAADLDEQLRDDLVQLNGDMNGQGGMASTSRLAEDSACLSDLAASFGEMRLKHASGKENVGPAK